jgi:decaprenylphospho-beta-D-erythro-pentofuranosid-2-ulose 2-reductase
MKKILIVGATSDMAKAIAKVYAKEGFDLILAARKPEDLSLFAEDLRIRSAQKIELVTLDLVALETHQPFYNALTTKPDGVILTAGYMAQQSVAETNWASTYEMLQVNYVGAVSLLNIVANDFESRRTGFIVGISSVAGERGRKTNYIYGSTKAALTAYLSGLRNRLQSSGVAVMTVKPGFVETKMTKGLDLPEKLTAQPEDVALAVFKAQKKGQDVLYTKGVWRLIMLIIKHIPESIFKKMSL